MTKAVQVLALAFVVLIALVKVGPTLTALIHALVPLVLVVGAVVAVLWLVRYFTQR